MSLAPNGEWEYHLATLNGDGTETFVDHELPLSGVQLTRVLSGPHNITGTLDVPLERFIDDFGDPIIVRWKSVIYACQTGSEEIWVGGIVADYDIDGPQLSIDCVGFTGYAKDQPYTDSVYYINEDPLDIVRAVWNTLQSKAGADLGLNFDATTTPIRIGTQLENVQFETKEGQMVQFEAGPIKFNWWSNHDIAGRVDELAKDTPFDYLETHRWSGEVVLHQVRLGYPTLGNRLTQQRFVLGENVFKQPSETYSGDDVPSGFLVLGSGEGRAMAHGIAEVTGPGVIRRIAVIQDTKLTSNSRAQKRAQQRLDAARRHLNEARISELVIRDHSHAPFGSFDVGDEVFYEGDHDWGTVGAYVKITKMTISPQSSEDIIATVERIDI